jgi:hypothetical protein
LCCSNFIEKTMNYKTDVIGKVLRLEGRGRNLILLVYYKVLSNYGEIVNFSSNCDKIICIS